MEDENTISLSQIRSDLENTAKSWDGKEVWFLERMLQFPCLVSVNTDDWGITVTIISEYYRKFNVSARWDVLRINDFSMSGLYCGWTLSKEMYYPELGIFPSEKLIISEKSEEE
ncbi:hypothetical protein N8809_06075 [Euryarchaeota archaeon]|nr:hypothetical protein [Euryarchaeota archaeon]